MVSGSATSSPMRPRNESYGLNPGDDTCNVTQEKEVEWLVDSGATAHMTPFKEDFSNLTIESCGAVQIGDNSLLAKEGYGEVKLKTVDAKGKAYTVRLAHVFYVPDLCFRLFSVEATNQWGHKLVFGSKRSYMECTGGTVVNLEDRGKGKVLTGRLLIEGAMVTQTGSLWHRRMGHIGKDGLKKLHKAVDGLEGRQEDNTKVCEPCAMGKIHREAVKKTKEKRATAPGEVVCTDVAGPFTESMGGKKYMIIFVDEYTRMRYVYFMKTKDNALTALKEFVGDVLKPQGIQLKRLHSDNGGEYTSAEMKKFCIGEGIHQTFTAPDTPAQMGSPSDLGDQS